MNTPVHADCPEVNEALLASELCLDCFFPIRIAGISTGGQLPDGVTTQSLCDCGGFDIGVTVGSWHPVWMIEVVTEPGCSPTATVKAQGSTANPLYRGTVGTSTFGPSDFAFFHVHLREFALGKAMDPFGATPCAPINRPALEYQTEWDPIWNHSALALWIHPEWVLLGNQAGLEACSLDAVAATAGNPIDGLFWCAGTWGTLYPLTGFMQASQGFDPRLHSLQAGRLLTLLHRGSLLPGTVGDGALCGGTPQTFLQKSQYRLEERYPGNEGGHHVIGAPPLKWHRVSAPHRGGAAVYIVWQWEDCCFPVY
jgi:conjugal transfer pilus assembly protein TraU